MGTDRHRRSGSRRHHDGRLAIVAGLAAGGGSRQRHGDQGGGSRWGPVSLLRSLGRSSPRRGQTRRVVLARYIALPRPTAVHEKAVAAQPGAVKMVKQSLCETCAWMREIVTPKGSRFLLCQLSQTNPKFPKYPRQP